MAPTGQQCDRAILFSHLAATKGGLIMRKQTFAFPFGFTTLALLGLGCCPSDLVDNPLRTGQALEDDHQEFVALESVPELEN